LQLPGYTVNRIPNIFVSFAGIVFPTAINPENIFKYFGSIVEPVLPGRIRFKLLPVFAVLASPDIRMTLTTHKPQRTFKN
jgi:hypothetical protein